MALEFGNRTLYAKASGSMATNATLSLVNQDTRPIIIDYIEWSTRINRLAIRMVIETYDGSSWQPLTDIASTDTADFTAGYPDNIAKYNSGLWHIREWYRHNDNDDIFKFSLKHRLFLPQGANVYLINDGPDEAVSSAVAILWGTAFEES